MPDFTTLKEFREGLSALPTLDAADQGAADLLIEAAGIVSGARNATHGSKERSFAVIAGLWNTYLGARGEKVCITPSDVAQMMVLLKIARSATGQPVRDHFLDQAGYSAIAGELA